jgi:AcrR family transcriptional regulator
MNQTVQTSRRRAAAADKAAARAEASARTKTTRTVEPKKVDAKADKPAPRKRAARVVPRTNDPERTMADILEVATHEFSEHGLAGARIDVIAEAMRTSKRMIYYYFGSKEGLYLAVLEHAYRRIRTIEADLHLEDLPPVEALRKLVGHTVDYQYANPDFVRLVMNENILKGAYLARSKAIQKLNVPAIDRLREVYERGVKEGVFRAGLDAIDLHMTISALSFFNVANRHSFALIFKRDTAQPAVIAARRAVIVETVVRYVSQQI